MWGSQTLTIHGVEYLWSAEESTEADGWRIDRFIAPDQNFVEVSGTMTAPVGVVAGYNEATPEPIHGFISGGSYYDKDESDTSSGPPVAGAKDTYLRTLLVIHRALDPSGNLVSETVESYAGNQTGNVFTVNPAGRIAGHETGYRSG